MQKAEEAPVGGLRSVVQRGAAMCVPQAGVYAGRQQERGHQHGLPMAGNMQRRQAAGALCTDVSTRLHHCNTDFGNCPFTCAVARLANYCRDAPSSIWTVQYTQWLKISQNKEQAHAWIRSAADSGS
jgi:hypothetical protein